MRTLVIGQICWVSVDSCLAQMYFANCCYASGNLVTAMQSESDGNPSHACLMSPHVVNKNILGAFLMLHKDVLLGPDCGPSNICTKPVCMDKVNKNMPHCTAKLCNLPAFSSAMCCAA